MAIENSITFGGINSADFGIYISGEGVFDAPKRDAEMITIPGRNGSFVLDNGRFENITVTYPAFNFESDYDTFVQNLSDFRNAICAQVGYQRLTDTFHPDEYRMAAYVEGLEIKPIKYNTASQFDIVFDCKPQRWLTSGEEAISVDSGDTLTNPTRFESGPLLEVKGYGTIDLNGKEIVLADARLGNVEVVPAGTVQASIFTANTRAAYIYYFTTASFNIGDTITCSRVGFSATCNLAPVSGYTISSVSSQTSGASVSYVANGDGTFKVTVNYSGISGSTTTADRTEKTLFSTNVVIRANNTDGSHHDYTLFFFCSCFIVNGNASVTIGTSSNNERLSQIGTSFTHQAFVVDSTISIIGNPTYIDCDLGEAYKIEDGTFISLNQHIDLGSELPTLAVGDTEITYDNTITELKVHPKWWKV